MKNTRQAESLNEDKAWWCHIHKIKGYVAIINFVFKIFNNFRVIGSVLNKKVGSLCGEQDQ